MKTIIRLLPLVALCIAACGESTQPPPSQPNVDTVSTVIRSVYTDIDPVCGMVRDSTWTDYTLYKGDTVWFCAAPEMRAFIANPEKYLALQRRDSTNTQHP